MDLSQRKTDVKRASDGVWISDIPGWGDLRIKVRGASSVVFRDAYARLQRDVPPSERNADRTLSTERADRLLGEILAEAGLVDWDNVSMAGEPLPYSKEAARELLTDPAHAEFRGLVNAYVERVGVIREDEDLDRLGK